MATTYRTEISPDGTTRLAEALATPAETYRAAAALAATVSQREPATYAVMRLHDLSHSQALRLADDITPYTPAFSSDRERIAFERGQEHAMGIEEE